ncbi:MAG: sugar phosphate isomerase/epimerase family protein, partial [Chloroflexota bacterium]
IRRIGEAGYGGVELNAEKVPWADPHVTPSLSTAQRKAIRRAAEETGVAITSISAHIGLVEAAPSARRSAIEFVKGCIDLALDLGTGIAHGLTGVAPAGVSRDEAWGWAVAAVGEIADYAEARGVLFGIEPVVGMVVSGVVEFESLLHDLSGHKVGMNYDPSHLLVHGDDPTEAARRFGPRIVAVHLKDARGRTGAFDFPPLGVGDVDFASLARALQSTGYGGPLVVEYEAQAYGGYQLSEKQVLEGSLAFVRRHFSEGEA